MHLFSTPCFFIAAGVIIKEMLIKAVIRLVQYFSDIFRIIAPQLSEEFFGGMCVFHTVHSTIPSPAVSQYTPLMP